MVSTAQKIKFSIKDFFSKCDQISRKLRIWLHLLKKSLENFIYCAVFDRIFQRHLNFSTSKERLNRRCKFKYGLLLSKFEI